VEKEAEETEIRMQEKTAIYIRVEVEELEKEYLLELVVVVGLV
jgi:hypothetical protein